ncbi:hypothetical protein BDQ12DRAFT_712856 [Crucibulum laeve]|uniref:Uncharacterized protein n=1 Tax=Crucibulum laeve TaxID=68775 RepID=A0A5C3M108_9AGAR|nr:hypothetical protein BDQ12DRAFT_712856 [Crucibulum laeve]
MSPTTLRSVTEGTKESGEAIIPVLLGIGLLFLVAGILYVLYKISRWVSRKLSNRPRTGSDRTTLNTPRAICTDVSQSAPIPPGSVQNSTRAFSSLPIGLHQLNPPKVKPSLVSRGSPSLNTNGLNTLIAPKPTVSHSHSKDLRQAADDMVGRYPIEPPSTSRSPLFVHAPSNSIPTHEPTQCKPQVSNIIRPQTRSTQYPNLTAPFWQ